LLRDRAAQILDEVAGVERDIKALRGRDTVRLGLTPSLMRVIGADLAAAANVDVPNLDIQPVESISFSLIDKLKRREVDLALVYNVTDLEGLTRLRLTDEELYFVASPKVALDRGPTISLAQALAFDLVIQTEQSAVYHIVLEAAKAAAIDLKARYSATSSQDVLQIVTSGLAAAILPASLITQAAGGGLLAARQIVKPKLARTLYLVRRRSRQRTRSDERLNSFLQRLFKEKGQQWFRPRRPRPGSTKR
jgi:LysR family nitrogen assimilation transcriptional regulator